LAGLRWAASEYERLERAGVAFHCPPQSLVDEKLGESVLVTYGRDPDGNIFELMQVGSGNVLSLPEDGGR
jgi:extradiol dioxygenase family protein